MSFQSQIMAGNEKYFVVHCQRLKIECFSSLCDREDIMRMDIIFSFVRQLGGSSMVQLFMVYYF